MSTLQKRFELQIKEEVGNREELLKEMFESEKAEFLKAIQENMVILDSMIKEFTAVKQQQIQRHVINVSPRE
jgi:hypothetical protein